VPADGPSEATNSCTRTLPRAAPSSTPTKDVYISTLSGDGLRSPNRRSLLGLAAGAAISLIARYLSDTTVTATTTSDGDATTTDFAFESRATVRVVWSSDDGERSAVLSSFRTP